MLRVLLVCTGNICRSPIAYGLLASRSERKSGGSIEVRSAGTWARHGSPPTSEAVSAAKEVGVDISGHHSSHFNRELAEWADLILTMTVEQSGEVVAVAPEARSKTFTIKEFVSLVGHLPKSRVKRRDALRRRVAQAHQLRGEVGPTALGRSVVVDADVADPLGLSEIMYRAVAHELTELVDHLVVGLVAQTPASPRKRRASSVA